MFDLENKSIHVSKIKLNFQSFSRNLFIAHNIKLCLVNKGHALWQIGDKCVSVRVGDVVILNNRTKRVFKEVDMAEGIELFVIEFEPQLFMNQFRGLFFGKQVDQNCVISGHREIQQLFGEIRAETAKKLMYSRIIIGAKLVEMLSLMMRHYNISDKSSEKMSSDIYLALEYIDEHYRDDISQQDAAGLIGMSTTNFSKRFTKSMGMGFAAYVMHKRIHYAIHLLQSSEKTVLEIALECGFNNTASFYKAFKKVTGGNPGEYRRGESEEVYI